MNRTKEAVFCHDSYALLVEWLPSFSRRFKFIILDRGLSHTRDD